MEFRRIYTDPTTYPGQIFCWQMDQYLRPWRGLRLAKVLGIFTCDPESKWLDLFAERQDLARRTWETDPQGVIPQDYRGGMGRVKWHPALLPEQEALPGLWERLETEGLILPPSEARQFLWTSTDADTERVGPLPDSLETLVCYAALLPERYLAVEALVTELRARLQPWWAKEEGPMRHAVAHAPVVWSASLVSHGKHAPRPLGGWPLHPDLIADHRLMWFEQYQMRARTWAASDGPNPYTPLLAIMELGCAVDCLDPHSTRLGYPPLNAIPFFQ